MTTKEKLLKILYIILSVVTAILANMALFMLHYMALVPLAFNDTGSTYMPILQLLGTMAFCISPLAIALIAIGILIKKIIKQFSFISYSVVVGIVVVFYIFQYINMYQPDNIITATITNKENKDHYSQLVEDTKLYSEAVATGQLVFKRDTGNGSIAIVGQGEDYYIHYNGDIGEYIIKPYSNPNGEGYTYAAEPLFAIDGPVELIINNNFMSFTVNGVVYEIPYIDIISEPVKVEEKNTLQVEHKFLSTIMKGVLNDLTQPTGDGQYQIRDHEISPEDFTIKLDEGEILNIIVEQNNPNLGEDAYDRIDQIAYMYNGEFALRTSILVTKEYNASSIHTAIEGVIEREYDPADGVEYIEVYISSHSQRLMDYLPCSNTIKVPISDYQ